MTFAERGGKTTLTLQARVVDSTAEAAPILGEWKRAGHKAWNVSRLMWRNIRIISAPPIFRLRRNFTTDQACKRQQYFASVAYWIVERIPVFAVLTIVIRDDVMKIPRFFEFGISARGPTFDVFKIF